MNTSRSRFMAGSALATMVSWVKLGRSFRPSTVWRNWPTSAAFTPAPRFCAKEPAFWENLAAWRFTSGASSREIVRMMPSAAAGPAWIACRTISARFCGSLLAARYWLTSRLTSADELSREESVLAAADSKAADAVIAASATAPVQVWSFIVSLFSAKGGGFRAANSTFYLAGLPAAIVPSVGLLAAAWPAALAAASNPHLTCSVHVFK